MVEIFFMLFGVIPTTFIALVVFIYVLMAVFEKLERDLQGKSKRKRVPK